MRCLCAAAKQKNNVRLGELARQTITRAVCEQLVRSVAFFWHLRMCSLNRHLSTRVFFLFFGGFTRLERRPTRDAT